jgi:hypothetical protein
MMSGYAIVSRLITLCFAAVIAALYLALCPNKVALAQTNIDEPFGLFTVEAPEASLSATWKELLLQVSNDLSIIARCRSEPQSCSSSAALKFLLLQKKANNTKVEFRLVTSIGLRILQYGHLIALTLTMNGDRRSWRSLGASETVNITPYLNTQRCERPALRQML